MTRSTLKTLWFAGGGVVATWLAVTPSDLTQATMAPSSASRLAPLHESAADNLIAQEAKLREHSGNVPLRPSTRNPFRFGKKQTEAPQRRTAAVSALPSAPAPPAQPSLTLSGIAGRNTPQGIQRTAIISGDGQLYLVTEGELVAGRFRVITVDSDAVTLKDENGTEARLVLH